MGQLVDRVKRTASTKVLSSVQMTLAVKLASAVTILMSVHQLKIQFAQVTQKASVLPIGPAKENQVFVALKSYQSMNLERTV